MTDWEKVSDTLYVREGNKFAVVQMENRSDWTLLYNGPLASVWLDSAETAEKAMGIVDSGAYNELL